MVTIELNHTDKQTHKYTLRADMKNIGDDIIDVDEPSTLTLGRLDCLSAWLGGWAEYVPERLFSNSHYKLKLPLGAICFIKLLKTNVQPCPSDFLTRNEDGTFTHLNGTKWMSVQVGDKPSEIEQIP